MNEHESCYLCRMETKHKNITSEAALLKALEQSQKTNDNLTEQNKALRGLIENLQHQIDKLQRMLFGQRTERQSKNKREPGADKIQTKQTKSSTKQTNGRAKLPADLPRTVVKHDLPEEQKQCQDCQRAIHCVGKDISEQLDIIPASLTVIEHRRYKYACRCCGKITMAPMPEQPIDKGLATSHLLAETLINKYQDHLPLYRQSQRYSRMGYPIARSTLCDWVMACAERLEPIVKRMEEDMLCRSPKIHSDDTSIPVLAKGKTHTGRLWVYIGGGGHAPPTVVYHYTKQRVGSEPQKVFKDYHGYLQADAYSGYDKCFQSGDIIEVACFAHARRYFVDAQKTVESDSVVKTCIDAIAELYKIENDAADMTDEQRYYFRKKYAKPILKRLYRWLLKCKSLEAPKLPLTKAINYALNHWGALNNYLRDGVLSIDNNIAERAMKSVVLGRKNYLFAGSHEGAENAATIYSLIETCKALGINTHEYLSDVLARMPTTLNRDIDSLIPYNWKPIKR